MNSPYKKEFIKAMMNEIKNYSERNYWTYYKKLEVTYTQILRHTQSFKIKCDWSTGEVVKFINFVLMAILKNQVLTTMKPILQL